MAVIKTDEACGAGTAVKYSQSPSPGRCERCRAKRVIHAAQLIEYAMRKNIAVRKSLKRVLFTTRATSLLKAMISGQQRTRERRAHSLQAQGDCQFPSQETNGAYQNQNR